MHKTFDIPTHGQGLYEFTDAVQDWVTKDGLLTLFVKHTSCSILVQENADPDVQSDLRAYFSRLVPPSNDPKMHYLRHIYEGPDDMPAHIKAALMPTSISVPVRDGKLVMGTWQGIYLFEHRDAPRIRNVAAHQMFD